MPKLLNAARASVFVASAIVLACGPKAALAQQSPDAAQAVAAVHAPTVARPASRWVSAAFSELPGFFDDALHEAWPALTTNCTRPPAVWQRLCPDIRRLALGSDDERRIWLMANLQPYRVESAAGAAAGQLTAYFEPVLDGARQADAQHQAAVYAPPSSLRSRKPWHTRAEIESLPEVKQQLTALLYLSDPIDAQVLAVQGSGRVSVREADGSEREARVVFAGSNEQPFRSMGRWLLDQKLTRDGSWDGVRQWLRANPERAAELLSANPRVVFFKEIPASDNTWQQSTGPTGAQGVPLTPGRSVAVDRRSVPLGTPLWISTRAVGLQTDRLVVAQDVGQAIVGAVRADYFVGSGEAAHEIAGRVKQSFRKWVLWPRDAALP